jgi:hypothetical protein
VQFPVEIAGAVTIALTVVLGVFIYPWLLKKRFGTLSVIVATLVLAIVYTAFQNAGVGAGNIALGVLFALLPVLTAVIVRRVG